MTVYYVDSASGSNTSPYDTWAKAATALATIAGIDAAGDTVYVASTHNESTAASVTLAWAGTAASPTRIICADKTSGAPPSTIATGGAVSITGANILVLASSGYVYFYGLTFNADPTTNNSTIRINQGSGTKIICDNCTFVLGNNNSNSRIQTGTGSLNHTVTRNCTYKFGATTQKFSTSNSGTSWFMLGGSIDGAGSAIATVWEPASGFIVMSGVDLSAIASAAVFSATGAGGIILNVTDCKMPASWSGSLCNASIVAESTYSLHNSDSADTHYVEYTQVAEGSFRSETTIIKTGGSADSNSVGMSWKAVTTANTSWAQPFHSGRLVKNNLTVGSAITVTVDFVHDSVTNLKDNEIWLSVEYLGTSGVPLASFLSDAGGASSTIPFGDPTNAGTDQTASGVTWTTTGLTNPNKQKLQVTFTPQEYGYIVAQVYIGKPSYTVYVDRELQIS